MTNLRSCRTSAESESRHTRAELIAEEMSLRELRRALGRTQVKVAKDLGIGQEAVSRLESRADMLISTLDRYIKEAGGELMVVNRVSHIAVAGKAQRTRRHREGTQGARPRAAAKLPRTSVV